jgi:hypothetical protein
MSVVVVAEDAVPVRDVAVEEGAAGGVDAAADVVAVVAGAVGVPDRNTFQVRLEQEVSVPDRNTLRFNDNHIVLKVNYFSHHDS